MKKKVGRPKIKLDSKQGELFGYMKATYDTMAEYLGVSLSTIKDRMGTENEFSTSYKRGWGALKMKLSEAQIQTALKGNATMQIWLGKQYLGQTDGNSTAVEERPIKIEVINESN